MQQIFRRFFFILSLATLLCQSWCSKLICREICVKRSPVGNKEMSALKYGIIYWAKIDRLIASRHTNTLYFLDNKLGNKFWKHASNVLCGVRGGEGYVWIGKRPRNSMLLIVKKEDDLLALCDKAKNISCYSCFNNSFIFLFLFSCW